MMQVSGLRAIYDMSRPAGRRLLELRIGNSPVDDKKTYRAATNSFIAQGGDLYQMFLQTNQTDSGNALSDVVIDYFRERGEIQPPKMGRLVPATPSR
ncbi:MAG TPA: 5'-nucleotidase, partial [Blastocatellia bacterium]|nr:5'-nucleotidase [Blastocatellia bacterium]